MDQSNKQHIVAKLDELSEIKAAVEITRLDYEAKRAEILKSVQAELDALDTEYNPLIESSAAQIAELETEIRNAVLQHGDSVKGNRLHAVYARGRVSWDTKGLDSYAATHPEVVAFRKQGEPSVSLRVVK
ncbi:MAG: hypothetical protein FJ009_11200 [Chloroflexi bacterium]|nr:hypothetical protein [Chloroflexota bacterium]